LLDRLLLDRLLLDRLLLDRLLLDRLLLVEVLKFLSILANHTLNATMTSTSGMEISPLCTAQSIFRATLGGALLGLLAASRLKSTGNTLPSSSLTFPFVTLGVALGGFLLFLLHDAAANGDRGIVDKSIELLPLSRVIIGGVLVGIGSRMGKGCTSGCGIQGISSMNVASLTFVCLFMLSGVITATITDSAAYLLRNTLIESGGDSGIQLPEVHLLVMSLLPPVLNLMKKDREQSSKPLDLLTGMSFASSLTISGMIHVTRVIMFLAPFSPLMGGWDPTLMFVMVGAILVTFIMYNALGFIDSYGGETFLKWSKRSVDIEHGVGGLLFGIGWGYAGLCPGPAITNVGFGATNAVVWTLSMFGAGAAYTKYKTKGKNE